MQQFEYYKNPLEKRSKSAKFVIGGNVRLHAQERIVLSIILQILAWIMSLFVNSKEGQHSLEIAHILYAYVSLAFQLGEESL